VDRTSTLLHSHPPNWDFSTIFLTPALLAWFQLRLSGGALRLPPS